MAAASGTPTPIRAICQPVVPPAVAVWAVAAGTGPAGKRPCRPGGMSLAKAAGMVAAEARGRR